MARTNARTQQMIGVLLDQLSLYVEQFHWHVENLEHRFPLDVDEDPDFIKAAQIVSNMLNREITKSDDRIKGADCDNVRWI